MAAEVTQKELEEMVAKGIAATERGEFGAGLQLLGFVYQNFPPEKFPKGLSSYGLCLAKAGKGHAGAQVCESAVKLEFYEGRHWANLVRVYIAAKNRRKAVEVLERGMKRMRSDSALLRVRDEIGYRKAPYFKFLSRTNPLNKLYSRHAARLGKHGKKIILTTGGILYLCFLASVFFAILE